ncbi:MAG TPA: PaaI family thioesterase [Vicinamibacterales bacterium]|jgi:uncharacterized protein (TIGR00369 family)
MTNHHDLPFARLLGIELVSVAPEKVVGHITVREDLCTKPATLHGGAMMAFADTLGALGTISNLEDGAATVTIESKTNFLRPAPLGARVTGEATPLHRGRQMMVWQTRLSDDGGRLIAVTTQTQLVIRG